MNIFIEYSRLNTGVAEPRFVQSVLKHPAQILQDRSCSRPNYVLLGAAKCHAPALLRLDSHIPVCHNFSKVIGISNILCREHIAAHLIHKYCLFAEFKMLGEKNVAMFYVSIFFLFSK